MEYVLLYKVGVIVNVVVKTGYLVAGGYFVKTAMRYISDYRDSVSNEGGVE